MKRPKGVRKTRPLQPSFYNLSLPSFFMLFIVKKEGLKGYKK
jgi:hypothetical protein